MDWQHTPKAIYTRRLEPSALAGWDIVSRKILSQTSLILVMGRPGTGKSTLCRALLKQISVTYLDIDSVSDVLRQYIRNVSSRKIANLTLRLIYRLNEQNLQNQASVLLDLPFVHEMTLQERRRGLQALARRSGAALIIIHCACSDRELKHRMSARATTQDLASRVWRSGFSYGRFGRN